MKSSAEFPTCKASDTPEVSSAEASDDEQVLETSSAEASDTKAAPSSVEHLAATPLLCPYGAGRSLR